MRPVTLGGTCKTIRGTVAEEPQLEFLEGLTGFLTSSAACGGQGLPAIPSSVNAQIANEKKARKARLAAGKAAR